MWMLPLYLHVNQKSDYDIYDDMNDIVNTATVMLSQSVTIFVGRLNSYPVLKDEKTNVWNDKN